VQHSTTSLNIDTGLRCNFSHPPFIIRVTLCRIIWLRHRRDGRLPRLIFEGSTDELDEPRTSSYITSTRGGRRQIEVCATRGGGGGAHRQRRQQYRRVGSRPVGPRTVSTATRRARAGGEPDR
jgi:hypothetical protein